LRDSTLRAGSWSSSQIFDLGVKDLTGLSLLLGLAPSFPPMWGVGALTELHSKLCTYRLGPLKSICFQLKKQEESLRQLNDPSQDEAEAYPQEEDSEDGEEEEAEEEEGGDDDDDDGGEEEEEEGGGEGNGKDRS
jgi:hypothetical protein